MKAVTQNFPVVMLIMPYRMAWLWFNSFEFVDASTSCFVFGSEFVLICFDSCSAHNIPNIFTQQLLKQPSDYYCQSGSLTN